jgi:hypothetical protein
MLYECRVASDFWKFCRGGFVENMLSHHLKRDEKAE